MLLGIRFEVRGSRFAEPPSPRISYSAKREGPAMISKPASSAMPVSLIPETIRRDDDTPTQSSSLP
jgi:hypothetical protein